MFALSGIFVATSRGVVKKKEEKRKRGGEKRRIFSSESEAREEKCEL